MQSVLEVNLSDVQGDRPTAMQTCLTVCALPRCGSPCPVLRLHSVGQKQGGPFILRGMCGMHTISCGLLAHGDAPPVPRSRGREARPALKDWRKK